MLLLSEMGREEAVVVVGQHRVEVDQEVVEVVRRMVLEVPEMVMVSEGLLTSSKVLL